MKYVNQFKEIKNGADYCGASCAAMITEQPPQVVADTIGPSADDVTIIAYIQKFGFTCNVVVEGGGAKTNWGRIPNDDDFEVMKKLIDEDNVLLYHIAGYDHKSAGHYTVLIGYDDTGLIINDPAGNRTQGYFNDNGQGAHYTFDEIKAAGIKRLWSII